MVKHYIFKFYENFNLESFDNKLLNIFTECELTDTKIKVTFDLSKIGLGSVYKLLSVKSILEQYKAKLMVIASIVGASVAVMWDYVRARIFGHN